MKLNKKATLTIATTMSLAIGGTVGANTVLALEAPKTGTVSQATTNAAIANARQGVVDKLTAQGATAAQITAAKQDFNNGLAQAQTIAQSMPANASTGDTQIPGVPKFERKTYDQLLALARQRLAQVKAGKPEGELTSLVSSLPRAGTPVGSAKAGNPFSSFDKSAVDMLVNQHVGRYLTFDGLRATIEGGDQGLAAALGSAGSLFALTESHLAGIGALLGLGGSIANLADPSVLSDSTKLRDAIAGTTFSAGYVAGYLVGLVSGPAGAVISAGTVAGQLIYALATQGWEAFLTNISLNSMSTLSILNMVIGGGPNSERAAWLQESLFGNSTNPSQQVADKFEKEAPQALREMLLSAWGAGWVDIAKQQGKAGWQAYQYLEQLAASFTAYSEVILDDAYANHSDHSKSAHESLIKEKKALRDNLQKHINDARSKAVVDQKIAIQNNALDLKNFDRKKADAYWDFGKKLFTEKRRAFVLQTLKKSDPHGVPDIARTVWFVDGKRNTQLDLTTVYKGYDKAADAAHAHGDADLHLDSIAKIDSLKQIWFKVYDNIGNAVADEYGPSMTISKVVDNTWPTTAEEKVKEEEDRYEQAVSGNLPDLMDRKITGEFRSNVKDARGEFLTYTLGVCKWPWPGDHPTRQAGEVGSNLGILFITTPTSAINSKAKIKVQILGDTGTTFRDGSTETTVVPDGEIRGAYTQELIAGTKPGVATVAISVDGFSGGIKHFISVKQSAKQ
ncbi:hypothetical protein ACH429_01185 [Streptomyces pathocidini]|uniref:Uncharacterized protein n=1 Tax=Streptomyces pathocidini TaxID=1650571 RepID=A0ABW7UJC5_9ACTN|nr:hypothetical protein [Streptomyces pathocidini]